MYFMNANEMALAIVASKINLEAAEESVVLRALAGRSEPEELSWNSSLRSSCGRD